MSVLEHKKPQSHCPVGVTRKEIRLVESVNDLYHPHILHCEKVHWLMFDCINIYKSCIISLEQISKSSDKHTRHDNGGESS